MGRKRGEELEIRISLPAEEKGGDDLFALCQIKLGGQRIVCPKRAPPMLKINMYGKMLLGAIFPAHVVAGWTTCPNFT